MSNDILISDSYAECYNQTRSIIDDQASSIIELISYHIGNLNDISVLDVGSGPGRLAVPIGQQVKRIVCVESDPIAASYLKSRLETSKVRAGIYVAKIQSLSNQELGQFDLVILSHIIHWFESSSPFGFSTNFVKNDGHILLSFFNRENLERMLFYKVSGKEILKIQEEDTLSTAEIEMNLLSLGFQIVQRVDIPIRVNYGNGRLEQIINNSGTLAWQKALNTFPKEEYRQIKLDALTRLNIEPCLEDTEYRSMILAKRVTSL